MTDRKRGFSIASRCFPWPARMPLCTAFLAGFLAAAASGRAEAVAGAARGISVNDKSGIEREIFSYFTDFGKGDVDAIMTHYADDAVFMPAGLPTVASVANIHAAYVETLKSVRILPGGQSVAEDAFVTGEFAWVRTDSRAEVLNPANGQKAQNHFREVFLLRKTNGQWKIWRYMFNTIEPAPAAHRVPLRGETPIGRIDDGLRRGNLERENRDRDDGEPDRHGESVIGSQGHSDPVAEPN